MAKWANFERIFADKGCPFCAAEVKLHPKNFPGVDAYCTGARCNRHFQVKLNGKNQHTSHNSSLVGMLTAILAFGIKNIYFVIGTPKKYRVLPVSKAKSYPRTRTFRPGSKEVARRTGIKVRNGKPVGYKNWTEVANAHDIMRYQDSIRFTWEAA